MVFVASAFGKLRSREAYRAFVLWLGGLELLTRRWRRPAAPVLVTAEVAVVILAALPWTAAAGLALAAALLAAFAAGALIVIRRKTNVPCQCFGPSSVPLGPRHVVRDVLLCAAAVFGAAGAGQVVSRPLGIGLSVGCGLAIALFAVFGDDVVALFSVQLSEGFDHDRRSNNHYRHPYPLQPGAEPRLDAADETLRRGA
jgi:hypothetical protein